MFRKLKLRKQIRDVRKLMKRAADEVDAAWVEELSQELWQLECELYE